MNFIVDLGHWHNFFDRFKCIFIYFFVFWFDLLLDRVNCLYFLLPFFGLDSPMDVFLFPVNIIRKGSRECPNNSFVLFSNLFTYKLVTTWIYMVFGAHAQTYFLMLGLYSMKMPCQFLYISDLYHFLFYITSLTTLSKSLRW